jgi:acetyltransferase-like isoleucine patch superfamily enzyme
VRKSLEQLGCELKIRVHGYRLLTPAFSYIRPDVAIKRGIDLATIEKLCQVFERVNFALLQIGRVKHAFPIFVRKACGADKNIHPVFNSLAAER